MHRTRRRCTGQGMWEEVQSSPAFSRYTNLPAPMHHQPGSSLNPALWGGAFGSAGGLHRCACALHCCAPAFSRCREGGLLSSYSVGASHCGGVSCCGALALGSAWALMFVTPELSCHVACGILFSRPGIESMSTSNTTPALASRFLTIGPPGKFLWGFL